MCGLLQLSQLNVKKATGLDNINSMSAFKTSQLYCSAIFSQYFQKNVYVCWSFSKWKVAKVTPIFKKGSKFELGIDYWPIAIVSRVILKVYYAVNSSSLLEILKWDQLTVRIKRNEKQKALMMFKPLHGLAPVYLKLRELFSERGTGYELHDPFCKLTFGNYLKRSFCHSSALDTVELSIRNQKN